jgi:hypothetical protein
MASSTPCAGKGPGGWDILCILNAKSGFALNCMQTIFKSRKIAIGALLALPIALCLCAVSERTPNNKDRDDY